MKHNKHNYYTMYAEQLHIRGGSSEPDEPSGSSPARVSLLLAIVKAREKFRNISIPYRSLTTVGSESYRVVLSTLEDDVNKFIIVFINFIYCHPRGVEILVAQSWSVVRRNAG